MVFQLNAQIPIAYRGYDYGRSQQNALRGMQMDAAERELAEQNALAAAYRESGAGLASDDLTQRIAAAGRIAAVGPRGYALAAPVLEGARNEREFNAIRQRFGGGAPAAAPVAPPNVAGGADPLVRIAAVESGGNDAARNPRSSAAGRFQIIDSTWNQYAPRLGLRPEQRMDPAAQEQVARASQADAQQQIGRPLSPGEAYGAHFLGIGGLRAFLSAPPDADAMQVYAQAAGPQVARQAFQSNPGLLEPGMTVAQVMDRLNGRMGGGGAMPAPGAPAGQRMPGMPTPAQFAELVDLAGSPNPRVSAWARAQVQAWAPFMRQEDPERFVETTRNIGGRQVVGQQNQRTGHFTPYPGQGGEASGITPAQARSDVLQLGPRVAAGEIQPGTPEYDRYEMAYRLATQDRLEWVNDPNNPGQMQLQRVPGIQLNPARFPPPVDGNYGGGGAAVVPPAGGATAAPPAPASAPAAPGASAAPGDATPANPAPITRPAPDSRPTGEENLSAGYAQRMVAAEQLLERAIQQGYVPGNIRDSAAGAIVGGSRAGPVSRFVGNTIMSEQGQLYRQAQEDWVRAKLRRESGAVIGEEEMAREIQVYFPQPGDSPAVIAQKAQARRVAIDAMRQASGRASATVPQVGGQPRRVSTPAEAAALPPGTEYITPDGSRYIR